MTNYIKDLIKAYKNIPIQYLDNAIESTYRGTYTRQEIERVISAELYHQWRCIMCNNKTKYSGLILHFQIGKLLSRGGNVEFPDFVLHGGQTGPNKDRNVLFLEIKMKTVSPDDIRKGLNAIYPKSSGNRGLGYEQCVYFIPELSIEEIKKEIDSIKNKGRSGVKFAQVLKSSSLHHDNFFIVGNTFKPISLEKLLKLNV